MFTYVAVRQPTRLLTLADLDAVTESLLSGALAVLPTETGYMLAALATSPEAVQTAFAVKERSPSAVMHVSCSSLRMARAYGVLDERAAALLGQFTPGPLTVVVPATGALPDGLVTVNGTVGIRVPDNPATLQVISALNQPLTATSLNSAGQAAVSLDGESLSRLNWPPGTMTYVVVDDDAITQPAASTLVRLTSPTPEILRPGPVTAEMIESAWPRA